jgi:predicted TPR repeat methyltransferase
MMIHTINASSGDLLADRRFEYAQGLAARGEFLAAAELLEQTIEIAPAWPPLPFHLGECLRQAGGRESEASTAFQSYLALDPEDHMGAGVKLALIGVIAPPETLPEEYVRTLFDDYAPRFDDALLNDLNYTTPKKMANAIRRVTNRAAFPHLLDLGCGTGLATAEVALICTHKVGVDLSQGMIDLANEKGLFDEVFVEPIEQFLTRNEKKFDLILCADVMVYIGVLEQIIKDCATALTHDGLFSFSVQHCDDENAEWVLGEDHRYAHSQTYIERCLNEAGLAAAHIEHTPLRKDGGEDINGMIVVCRKKAG